MFKIADLVKPTETFWLDGTHEKTIGAVSLQNEIGEIVSINAYGTYSVWWPKIRETTKHFKHELKYANNK